MSREPGETRDQEDPRTYAGGIMVIEEYCDYCGYVIEDRSTVVKFGDMQFCCQDCADDFEAEGWDDDDEDDDE